MNGILVLSSPLSWANMHEGECRSGPDKLALQGCNSAVIMGYDDAGLVWRAGTCTEYCNCSNSKVALMVTSVRDALDPANTSMLHMLMLTCGSH